MSTVLVIGSTGFIGHPVALAFKQAGFRVLALVRSADKAVELVRAQVELVPGDVTNVASWKGAAAQADVIVHCAVSYQDMVSTDRIVLDAVDTIVAETRSGGKKTVLYTSGGWVYGNMHEDDLPATEQTSTNNAHALVKWRAEHEQRVLSATAYDGIVLRPSCVYGRQGSLTAMFIGAALNKDAPLTFPSASGDGKQMWPMVHTDDLARAFVLAALKGRPGHVYNVASEEHRVDDMVAAVYKAAGHAKHVNYVAPSNPFEQCLAGNLRFSSAKARNELGWVPFHTNIVDEAPQLLAAFKSYVR